MLRTALKLAKFLVGGHLLLGLALIVTDAIHGVNDQDASFALALLVHTLNLPSVWLLNVLGVACGIVPIVLVGILQWTMVAFIMAALCHLFCLMIPQKSIPKEDT